MTDILERLRKATEADSAILTAMARAIYEDRNGFGCKKFGLIGVWHQKPYISDAKAALSALFAALAKESKP